MSRSAFPALGVALALVASLAFGGCAATSSSDPGHPQVLGDAGATDEPPVKGDDSAGDSGEVTSHGGGGAGLPSIDTGSDAGSGDGSETCAAELTTAEIVPLDMYLMVDSSGSMLDTLSTNSTKWSQVKSALRTFLRDTDSAGLGVGMQFFPLIKPNIPEVCGIDADCGAAAPCIVPGMCWEDSNAFGQLYECLADTDCFLGPCVPEGVCQKNGAYYCPKLAASCGLDDAGADLGTCQEPPPHGFCSAPLVCEANAYASPAQPIAALPDSADALIAALDARVPGGRTPTGPALRGALQQATTWAKKHADHRVVVVLATDGLPTDCTPTNIDEVGDIAFDAVSATPSVKTVVIGVLTAADVNQGAKTQLDTVAHAGGTDKAIIVDTTKDVASQFLAALDSIRTDPLACEFKVPESGSGKPLDYARVNVNFKEGKRSTPLYYVDRLEDCDPDTGGWYYDTDPMKADPKTIYACPANCTAFQASTKTSVEIALGCETIVK